MMPTDRCPRCDRLFADSSPAPEGACGVWAANAAERRAGDAVAGMSLGGQPTPWEAAREAPIKVSWIAYDGAVRARIEAERDCAAHAVDWPARCRVAELDRDRDRARRDAHDAGMAFGEVVIERDVAQARCLALAVTLRCYGAHLGDCSLDRAHWRDGDEKRCTCGLGAAITGGGR